MARRLVTGLLYFFLQLHRGYPFKPPGSRWLHSSSLASSASSSLEVLDKAEAVAIEAARTAGQEILRGMGADVRKEKANFKDIVTEVDGKCQELIRSKVSAAFPSHFFLGEEDVAPGAAAATEAIAAACGGGGGGDDEDGDRPEWVWICDPVDGTTNLAAGIPLVTTSIALARNGVAELGVVFDPNRDELFVARRGRGYATLNGERLRCARPDLVSGGKGLRDAVLCVGNPPEVSA